MASEPERLRRSLRLKGYDYAQPGAYFVTVVTQDRACLFGAVVDGAMQLNALGEMVREEWLRSAEVRPNVALDAFVIMPNHVHGIIVITAPPNVGATRWVAPTARGPAAGVGATDGHGAAAGASGVGATRRVAPTARGPAAGSVGAIIGQFKSVVTKRINQLRGTPGAPVWQRNYYEHVIRDEASLDRIRRYIAENPLRWDLDRENPDRVGEDAAWDALFGSPQRPQP